MTTRNHDIIVVGMELGGLVAAALLVKRGKNVLVADPSGGRFLFDSNQLSLAPSPNVLVGLASGGSLAAAFRELDVPIHRRREFAPAEPAFQVIMPGKRVDLSKDRERLARQLARTFRGDARKITAWMAESEQIDRRYNETLRAPDLVPAPKLVGGKGPGKPAKELDRALTAEDRLSFEESISDLGQDGRAFLTACCAFLTRFGHREMASVLARFHVGQIAGGLHQAPDGIGSLTGLLKEKIASLRGAFCQAEGVQRIDVGRSPRFRLRLTGLEDEFTAQTLIWNTDPALLADWLPGRVRRSMRRRAPEATGAAVATIPVRLRAGSVPVGMADDCVLVSDPAAPLSGTNLLVLTVPPRSRTSEECVIEVSFRVENADGWDRTAAQRDAAAIRAALADPIPFLDKFLVELDVDEAIQRLTDQRYERLIQPHILPLGEGAVRIRTSDAHLLYAGRQAMCGLGMLGETVGGRIAADHSLG